MAVAVVQEDRLSLVQAEAIAAIERAGGDRTRAARLLEQEAKKSPSLLRDLMERELAKCCWDAIRDAERRLKPNTLSALPVWSQPDSTEAAEIRLREADRLSSLYFWTLPDGKALGDAKREDLIVARDHYWKQITPP